MTKGVQVFLSYSSKDDKLARHIQAYLVAAGAKVWFDEYEIKAGDSIISKIEKGLETCSHVLVLLTTNSVRSGWVEQEWKTKFSQEIQSNRVSVIPVLAESCEIPVILRDKKYADIRGGNLPDGMKDVLAALGIDDTHKTTRERDLITSQAIDLLSADYLKTQNYASWSVSRRLSAVSAALYSHPVKTSDVQQDFLDYSGLSQRVASLALTSAGKILLHGKDGSGKTSLLNSIASVLTTQGARIIYLDPLDDVDEGGCYYLSHCLLNRFCEAGIMGTATAHVRHLLKIGLQEGGLWWSGVREGSRFVDSVLENLWKFGETVVVILDNIDGHYEKFSQDEVADEFLRLTAGSYIATSVSGGEDWLCRYIAHQIPMPIVTGQDVLQMIEKRTMSLPFDTNDLVKLDPSLGEALVRISDGNLNRVFELCRQTISVRKRLTDEDLRQTMGYSTPTKKVGGRRKKTLRNPKKSS